MLRLLPSLLLLLGAGFKKRPRRGLHRELRGQRERDEKWEEERGKRVEREKESERRLEIGTALESAGSDEETFARLELSAAGTVVITQSSSSSSSGSKQISSPRISPRGRERPTNSSLSLLLGRGKGNGI